MKDIQAHGICNGDIDILSVTVISTAKYDSANSNISTNSSIIWTIERTLCKWNNVWHLKRMKWPHFVTYEKYSHYHRNGCNKVAIDKVCRLKIIWWARYFTLSEHESGYLQPENRTQIYLFLQWNWCATSLLFNNIDSRDKWLNKHWKRIFIFGFLNRYFNAECSSSFNLKLISEFALTNRITRRCNSFLCIAWFWVRNRNLENWNSFQVLQIVKRVKHSTTSVDAFDGRVLFVFAFI